MTPDKLKPSRKILVHVVATLFAVLTSAILVFSILFLAKVLPHGGI